MKNLLYFWLLSAVCFGVAYYIETPFDETEVPELQYAQADNEMYLVSGTDIPQVLTRTAHNAWTIADMTMETGPFMPMNTTSTTITPDNNLDVGDTVTLTASGNIFSATAGSTHVGSIWQIDHKRPNVFQGSIDTEESNAGTGSMTYFFKGGYSFVTEGTWDGTITLERSENGTDWSNALDPLTDTNFDNYGETETDGAYYRVTGSDWTSGICNYTLTITDEYNHGIVEITAVNSATEAEGTVISAIYSTDATKRWREGYWSDYRGWPKTVCFHQQRLIFGGSASFPQTIWFGQQDPDEYYNFTEGTLDTDAFTAALPGQNPIRWLLSGDYLFIGTSGSTGTYGEIGKSITPTSPNYRTQSVGAEATMAVWANDTILYVERGAEKVREFKYQLEADKYLSSDLTLLAEDITDTGIKEIAFQQRPYPILWCVLNSGDIATMTFQRDQGVIGWATQTTDGDFESVATIPGSGSEDEVWVVAKRTIGGTDYRFVEQFQPIDWGDDPDDCWFVDSGLTRAAADYAEEITNTTFTTDTTWVKGTGWTISGGTANFSGSGTGTLSEAIGATATRHYQVIFTVSAYTGTTPTGYGIVVGMDTEASTPVAADGTYTLDVLADNTGFAIWYKGAGETVSFSIDNLSVKWITDSFTGLTHLEGESVQVYADEVVLGDETVASGAITIDERALRVTAGLPYTAILETMPLTFAPNDQTYEKKLMRLWVDLLDTGDLQYGSHSSNLYSVNFEDALKTSTVALEKYTFPPGSKGKATVYLSSEEPVPVTIRALVPEITPYPQQ